jgi:flagellar hook assembly protein FlgD
MESMEIPPISFFQPAFPNPFSTQVTFSVELTEGTDLDIDIFDLLGRKVKTLYGTDLMPGIKHLNWDGKNDLGQKLGNGMYFAQPDKNSGLKMVKLVMMKN